jgi:hypothetical protein
MKLQNTTQPTTNAVNVPYTRKTKRKMILSTGVDAKTVKGEKMGYLTGILYLSPSNLSGVQLCPFASLAGCEIACLNSAGRGAFSNVQKARHDKAQRFNHDRNEFMLDIVYSVHRVILEAKRKGLIPVIRLNGTSDIQWEKIPFKLDGITYSSVMAYYPTIQFYDYSKIPTRSDIPANYDLTFSYSGIESFQGVIDKAMHNPAFKRIAVVFSNRDRMPASFLGRNVIDGDDSDLRFLDADGVVVGLYAKGKAKRDLSGFVVKV